MRQWVKEKIFQKDLKITEFQTYVSGSNLLGIISVDSDVVLERLVTLFDCRDILLRFYVFESKKRTESADWVEIYSQRGSELPEAQKSHS